MRRFQEKFGFNIRMRREMLRKTQADVANEMNDIAYELGYDIQPVTPDHVSKWERGTNIMNIIQEDLMMRVLLTSKADIHGIEERTDLDDKLRDVTKSFSFRSKEIMYFILHKWEGNAKALLEADLMYCALPPEERVYAIEELMTHYLDIKHKGLTIQPPMAVDVHYVKREQEKL